MPIEEKQEESKEAEVKETETQKINFKIKRPGESEFSDETIEFEKPKEDSDDDSDDDDGDLDDSDDDDSDDDDSDDDDGDLDDSDDDDSDDDDSDDDDSDDDDSDDDDGDLDDSDDDDSDDDDSDDDDGDLDDSDDDDSDDDDSDDDDSDDDDSEEFNVVEFSEGEFETLDDLKDHIDFLKENPDLKGMLEYYQENGTLLPYLQATQIDVDKFSDLEIMREAHRSENASLNLPEDELAILFDDEVLSKYKIDDEDESVAKIAKIKLKKDAAVLRQELKDEQAKLKLPKDRDGSEAKEAAERQAKADAKAKEAAKNKLGFALRKEVKDGKMTVKINEDTSVTLKVSPKKISQLLEKTSDLSLFQDKEGNFDVQTMAFLTDKDGFLEKLISNSEAEGGRKTVKKNLKNRNKKPKNPEGDGKQKKPVEKLDPTKVSSLKGAKIIKRSYPQ